MHELAVMSFGVTFLIALVCWASVTERMDELAGILIFTVSFCTGLFLLSMVCTALWFTLTFFARIL